MAEAIGYIGSRRRLWRELTGRESHDFFADGNPRILHGTSFEPMALALYGEVMNYHVAKVGYMSHPMIDWIGGSPDGLVLAVGGVEVKCPAAFYEEIPDYYMPQMQSLMQITGARWWDFVVWTPEEASITRVHKSQPYWDQLYELLCEFWAYVEADVEPPAFKRGTKPRITAAVETRLLHKE
jgi:hypothetical protein